MEKQKKSIVLLHGVFESSFYPSLKNKGVEEVFILEGRPNLTGAKKTSVEALKAGIRPILIADNMAGFLFFQDLVKEVYVAYEGMEMAHAVCPIGALILGVLAKKHGVPLYVYKAEGKSAQVGRDSDIFEFNGMRVAPPNVKAYVPLIENLSKNYITNVYDFSVVPE